MSFMFLIVVGLGLVLVAGLVVLVIALATRGRRSPPPSQVAAPPAIPPEQQQAMRTQVLQELSAGSITREEAEQKMAAMRQPAPVAQPATGAASSGGRGCLWAAIIALAVVGLGVLVLLGLMFAVHVPVARPMM